MHVHEDIGWERSQFLAHQIRISDTLSSARNSFLAHVILPRLSCEGCIINGCIHGRQVTSFLWLSDVIMSCRISV